MAFWNDYGPVYYCRTMGFQENNVGRVTVFPLFEGVREELSCKNSVFCVVSLKSNLRFSRSVDNGYVWKIGLD